MPKLRQNGLGITLYLVGTSPTSEMLEYAKTYEDIFVTGRVESIDPFIKDADIFINAIELGSGLNIKLIEAMGKGIPVISSEFGVRGFSVADNKDVIIYTSLEDLATKVEMLMNNPALRLELSNNAASYYNGFIKQDKDIKDFFERCRS